MDQVAMNDAAMPDAAMMEANIDDLFGEAAGDLVVADALGVALPAAPLPPSLVSRIAEMQWRGCCTKLIWSGAGFVAQIVDQGRKIALRTTLHNAKTGEWTLTAPSKHPIEAPEGVTFEHISASRLGLELAVIDSRGTVRVHSSLNSPLGRLPQSPAQTEDTKSIGTDLNEVVGLHWLALWPTEFRVPLISTATKIGDKWVTNMRQPDMSAPSVHHVVDQRNALLYVSRDANLTLMYQNEGTWHSNSMKLEKFTSSDQLLSHAAMGENGDHLLLVTFDLAKRFRLYKISITWNASQHPRPNGNGSLTLVAPALDVAHLTAVENAAPQHADAARLSSLRIIPPVPALADEGTPTFPTILAIFTRAHLPVDPTQQPQEAFSVISRWHLESVVPALHESFVKLKKGNALTPTQAAVAVLRRQEDIITNRIVTSVRSEANNTVLVLPASDGTVEFRDRATMTSIEPYGESDAVSSLPQSGFEHPLGEHNVHVAISADASALVRARPDGALSMQTMALRYSWQPLNDGISDTRGLIEAAVVCAARQYAHLACSNVANEENLALLPHDLSTELRYLFVKETVKIMHRTIDISGHGSREQSIMIIKELLVPRAMSAQLVLATMPGEKERSVVSKFAYCFLHMRSPSTYLMQIITQHALYLRPDALHSLRGMMKWASDLLVYVVQTLWKSVQKVKDAMAAGSSIKDAFLKVLVDEERSPALHLVLNAMSRAFMRFLVQHLPKYLTFIQRVLPGASSVVQRQELQDTYEQCTVPQQPFKYNDLELLLQAIDASVRKAYSASGAAADRRMEAELELLCEPTIPDEFIPVLQDLLDDALPNFTKVVDQEKLFFRNTAWLGIDSLASTRKYDGVKKLPLPAGAKVRECRRCGAVMEDVDHRKVLPWMAAAQRSCVCGSAWWLVE